MEAGIIDLYTCNDPSYKHSPDSFCHKDGLMTEVAGNSSYINKQLLIAI